MNIVHADQIIELSDEWLREADMAIFIPEGSSYLVDSTTVPIRDIFEVPIVDIAPVRRSPGIPIFNADPQSGRTARERVVSILRGFRSRARLPPVEVVALPEGRGQRYKLTAGVHRFYCSLAVGFSSVPAVTGFDWESLDQ